MSKYIVDSDDLAGFDLCGYYRNNKHYMESGRILDDLPAELEMLGQTYTLEYIKYETNVQDKGQYFNAVYV